MKKYSRSAGFGVIGIVIVVAALVAVSFFVYMYAQQGKSPSSQNTQTGEPTAKKDAVITEWGVKIALRDADKVNFTVITEAGELPAGQKFDAQTAPSFKPEFLKNKDCSPGITLYRSTTVPENIRDQKQIGSYYYFVTGAPSACSDDIENNPDDQLKARFLEDFKLENVTSL